MLILAFSHCDYIIGDERLDQRQSTEFAEVSSAGRRTSTPAICGSAPFDLNRIMKILLSVLKCLTFFHAGAGYRPVVGLLILSIMSTTSQATSEKERMRYEMTPRDGHTDRRLFLQSSVNTLQKMIRYAQSVQRKIRNNPLYRTARDQQQALKPWQRVESHARQLLAKIQDQANMLETQALQKQLQARRNPATAPRVVANDVLLTRLDGKTERMATHRGDVVLLHFWATWCRPCVKEIPSLQRLYQQFRSRDFTVLAVSLDARKQELRKFFQRQPLHLPVYFDPGRVVYQEMIGGLEVLPRSLLIDKEGRIVQSYTGAQHLAAPETFMDIRNLLDTN